MSTTQIQALKAAECGYQFVSLIRKNPSLARWANFNSWMQHGDKAVYIEKCIQALRRGRDGSLVNQRNFDALIETGDRLIDLQFCLESLQTESKRNLVNQDNFNVLRKLSRNDWNMIKDVLGWLGTLNPDLVTQDNLNCFVDMGWELERLETKLRQKAGEYNCFLNQEDLNRSIKRVRTLNSGIIPGYDDFF